VFPLIKLAKKLKGEKYDKGEWTQEFPLIKLAKKLKGVIDSNYTNLTPGLWFPLIKLAKKLKEFWSTYV